jgi:hypothetical protein
VSGKSDMVKIRLHISAQDNAWQNAFVSVKQYKHNSSSFNNKDTSLMPLSRKEKSYVNTGCC